MKLFLIFAIGLLFLTPNACDNSRNQEDNENCPESSDDDSITYDEGSEDDENNSSDDDTPYPFEDPDYIDVFISSDGLYPIYRIPAIITTQKGTLLAFAEGRQSTNDHSHNDMVMRRSPDGGFSWGPVSVIAEEGDDTLSDPLPVQITEGPNKGRILFFYTRFPNGCHHDCVEPGYDGPKNSRNYMLTSDDDGLTWQGPIELTRQFKPCDVNYVSGGPGFAIEKKHSPNIGRIVLPYRAGNPTEVFAIFSDNGGETWKKGQYADDSITEGRSNEVQIVELPDGSLYLNARSAKGTKHRKVAYSYDAGETWTPLVDDPELVEPQVMASIFQFSDPADGDIARLLYSGPNNSIERIFGEIKLSYDNGETWPASKIVWPGIFAYSVLTRIDCNTVGLLFEDRIWFHQLTLARFSIEWLTDGADRPACE